MLAIDSIRNQGHNQTVGNIAQHIPLCLEKKVESCMNKVAPPFTHTMQDVPLAHSEMFTRKLAGANPVLSEEIIHELRQPLGVIDSLAYYLELTAADETLFGHLEQIRAMVSQANGILERAAGPRQDMPMANPYISGS